jgi:hypothetical protein
MSNENQSNQMSDESESDESMSRINEEKLQRFEIRDALTESMASL